MGGVSSYQKRLNDIKYLAQYCRELEERCAGLEQVLTKNGIPVPLLGKGVGKDDYLTPCNMSEELHGHC